MYVPPTGQFVVPIEAFTDNDDVGYCFANFQIGHNRKADDFEQSWYDVIEATEDEYKFYYEASSNSDPIYFTVESYMGEQVPSQCTKGTDS